MTLTKITQSDIDASVTKAALEIELTTLKADCDALDVAAVRALRAVAAGAATSDDKTYLTNNEAAVAAKRLRIAEIISTLGV